MNGAHDMGGEQNFGPVRAEANEPVFHHRWEARVLGLNLAMAATRQWNIDQGRAAIEGIEPATYLAMSYYEKWFERLCRLLIERGLVTREELSDGRMRAPAKTIATLAADNVIPTLKRGVLSSREIAAPARFKVGDGVRTKNMNPPTHTRLPRYCRDKPGTIAIVHGAHVYPDASALGRGDDAHWLYTVRFEARDLWGCDTTASAVYADVWEPYLA
jgi:nitrile hydratase beta subunit